MPVPKDATVEHIIGIVTSVIEAVGVLVLVLGALVSCASYLRAVLAKRPGVTAYDAFRENLGRAILLGLEFLVIADIIGTVAVAPTYENVGVLAAIVIIRTFLSFALQIEIEGRLPWRRNAATTRPTSATERPTDPGGTSSDPR